jgi:uroporphyrinogen-III synthase
VLRGNQGRNDLIEVLRQASIAVSAVAMYDKIQHPMFAQDLNAALDRGSVALYLSSTDQAARLLATASDKATLLACPLIASHVRIADAALALGYQTVTLNQNYL